MIVISLWKVLESFLYPGVLNFQRSELRVGLFIVIMLVLNESFIYFIGKLSCIISFSFFFFFDFYFFIWKCLYQYSETKF